MGPQIPRRVAEVDEGELRAWENTRILQVGLRIAVGMGLNLRLGPQLKGSVGPGATPLFMSLGPALRSSPVQVVNAVEAEAFGCA